MNHNTQERMERRRKAVYNALKSAHPGLYRRAVEVAHMALIEFGGRDETKRAAIVEACIMELLLEATETVAEYEP